LLSEETAAPGNLACAGGTLHLLQLLLGLLQR
jgi:hypothetical protein